MLTSCVDQVAPDYESGDHSRCDGVQIKATEQHFTMVLLIMLYKEIV